MTAGARIYELLRSTYRFLPVQLLVLHFRKYQFLLLFWLILFATVTGNFAQGFGASTLFLAPEYLGNINISSMFLLGGSMAVFIMAWNITTFIIHSHRIPFMGATRQSFLKYCINNALLPLSFLVFYSIISIRFQLIDEHMPAKRVFLFQLGFYLGLVVVILLSFAYFFRVDRDLLKVLLSRITNPSRIREIIPYDSLDYEIDIIRADTYLTGRFKIKHFAELEPFHPRFLQTVLRRHHRNAITATIFAMVVLLLLGIFMEDPRLRIPAGGGFLILFSIIMGLAGAMKYFLRSWEIFGWIFIVLLVVTMVRYNAFDLRSIAYGLDYHTKMDQRPIYDYDHLHAFFTPQRYEADKRREEERLDVWKAKNAQPSPALIVVSVSGGGSRAAYWTFRSLQYLDSITKGAIFNQTVMMTGASGGMIGAAYWREVHSAYSEGNIHDVYAQKYQDNIGKDLLNAIVFSFASVDLISPFNRISLAGYSYTRDRGYAMEQEMIRNTEGMLDRKIGDYEKKESNAEMPMMIINGTITNDGRKLMVAAQPVSYLTQPEFALEDTFNHPPVDAVDFGQYFPNVNPYNMRLTTALRMNATFPFILPVVRLPSEPQINIMDAGMRDNFGVEAASRYLFVLRDWIEKNAGNVIFLQIRDTRESEVLKGSGMDNLSSMMSDPLFVIQDKWEAFESYYHGYLKDYVPRCMKDKMHFITLQYIPEEGTKAAALNFHLTKKEQEDIYQSIHNPQNERAIKALQQLIQPN